MRYFLPFSKYKTTRTNTQFGKLHPVHHILAPKPELLHYTKSYAFNLKLSPENWGPKIWSLLVRIKTTMYWMMKKTTISMQIQSSDEHI